MVIILTSAVFLFLLSPCATILSEIDDPPCSISDAEKRLLDAGDNGNCLSALRDPLYRQEFETCKEKVCFLLMREPPFVTYEKDFFHNEKNVKNMQLPFLCKNQKERPSLAGSALKLLKSTSARDELCVWAGPVESCTWNAIVDFVAVMGNREGYQFAVVGPMLETPQRKCSHFASSSWWDGRIVVLGRNTRENRASVHPVRQLISPFQKETWIVVGSVIALFVIVCLIIVYRFHVFRGKSLITAITAYFVIMGERAEALATRRVARGKECTQQYLKEKENSSNDLERALSAQSTLKYEAALPGQDAFPGQDAGESRVEEEDVQQEAVLTKFSVAISLFRVSLIAFVAMFSLFYGVAVVNFLFQQHNIQITKDIKFLTAIDLERYSMVQDTAIEAIWNSRGGFVSFFYICSENNVCANSYPFHPIG
ncbi:hypothetical protein FGB62_93g035 [Gracilaria domingensis]|nr:hypothetical protein FGB62_93g035 [Gracilaria domingensis]